MLSILTRGGGRGGKGEDGGEEVKLVVVWVGMVFAEFFALSDGSHFVARPLRVLPRPLAEVKSRG